MTTNAVVIELLRKLVKKLNDMNKKRVFAFVVDASIIQMIGMLISNAITMDIVASNFMFFGREYTTGASWIILIYLGYFVLFDICWSGVTLGKKLFSVRIERAGSDQITLADNVMRSVLKIISIVLLPVSVPLYLFSGWSFHDKICKTKTVLVP